MSKKTDSGMLSVQSVEKVCFISRFRKTPGEGFPLFRPFRTKNSPFLRFMKHKEFRRLRTATKALPLETASL